MLFALSLAIVLTLIDTPADTFTISRPGDFHDTFVDLDQEESIRLEVRDDLTRPNELEVSDRLLTSETETKEVFSIPVTTGNDQTPENSSGTSKSLDFATGESSTAQEINSDSPEANENNGAFTTTSKINDDEINKSTFEKYGHISQNHTSSEEKYFPSWKKYTIINRKPINNLHSDHKMSENRSEEMITDETGHPLQDSKTGDIPSLNQIKSFLSFFKSDAQNDTTSSKEVTDQSVNDNLGQIQQNTPTTTAKEIPATVESKRGGFLDFSLKSLFEDNDDKKDGSQELSTQRPKNRKLSWRIGSRYRNKEDNSAEKQGRIRFRFRNDDDKNNNDRKKDKADIKTIPESQEEINTKNKDADDKNKISISDKEQNDNNREDSSVDLKNNNESKEQGIHDDMKGDVKENSRDRNGSKTDQQILKEWQDFDQKQERKDNINITESTTKDFDDNKNDDEDLKNINYFQSKDAKETTPESNKKEINTENFKQNEEKKEQVVNIWKIDSKEDYDQSRSRQRNEKGQSKDRDNDRRNNSKGEYRNRENQNLEKPVNDKNDDRYRSRIRNEKVRDNDQRSEKSERDKEERNHNNRNSEKIMNEKYESRSRSRPREEDETSDYNRRQENSKNEDRNNNRRSERPDKNKEERHRDNKSSEKIMNDKDESRSRSRSRSRNEEESSKSNSRSKEFSRDRDNNRRNEKFEKNIEERIRDNKSSEKIMIEKDESRSRSRSRNEDETSNNNSRRKESSRNENRDSRRNENLENIKQEKSRDNKSSEKIMNDKDESKFRSRSRNEEESTNSNRRNQNSKNRESERIRSQSRNDNERENDNRKFQSPDKIDTVSQKQIEEKNAEINKSTLKIDIETVSNIPTQTPIQEEYNENKNEESEYKQSNKAPMLDEYTKKFLSTIEEEDETETQGPAVIENESFTSKTKQTEQQNIVAVKYPSDFKFNDMETTQENLEPNEPYKITTVVNPDLSEELKIKENYNVYLATQKDSQSKVAISPDVKIQDNRIVFKDDKVEERKEGNKFEKQTTFQPYPTLSEERTTANDDYGNKKINVKESETFIQMNEDDIREEFLKEEMINNYEENKGRYQGDSIETTTMPQTTIPVKIYEVSKPVMKDTSDEKLSVKPLSILEKLKTTILYPVSPNYKPPKKIEVQPPKTFVRDPDDNSWRNESLSSLGIVFNPKNSSKPFTQVLKNKTETEWNNLLERSNKNETPDLRERLEKIAEMRKTKKKKTDAYGNVYYNDYEDGNSKENVLSNENYSSVSTESYRKSTTLLTTEITTTTPKPTTTTSTQATTTRTTQVPTTVKARIDTTTAKPKATTEKTKKVFNVAEYYDSSDEDDADYLTLAKIDLKKFTVPIQNTPEVNTPPSWPVTNNRYTHNRHDDRKPTVQYFPPLTTQKAMYNNKGYDDFNHKMNAYTDTAPPTNVLPVSYPKKTTSLPKARKEHMFTPTLKSTFGNSFTTKPIQYENDAYITPAPEITAGKDAYTFVTDDGSFNKASDVIKHYRDFLNAVAKDHEEDKNADYIQYTKIPTQGVTLNDAFIPKAKTKPDVPENYDYDTDYKKDVLQRFVHNFNENSERFKSNLPLLYNNSIIHSELHGEHGRDVASSRAYLSRLLTRPDGDCENNSTVELSPAYELHYYVPEQEEKEELDPKSVTLPYQYQL
ncbi:putative uncharacterized protein DDB_G0282133 isoform X2 [Zerene cesonia]|uniref:putative uncharacterized protein DDB_G0282133 isoform X2 n=1 Tax=Zerene cesonia TaxID=33412 RepID=UPI0018E5438E|nr:putative uncharacterized protein DDB_G0282133 isoform X2 [Zerene cesonia]